LILLNPCGKCRIGHRSTAASGGGESRRGTRLSPLNIAMEQIAPDQRDHLSPLEEVIAEG
jgi:hypothetical protein